MEALIEVWSNQLPKILWNCLHSVLLTHSEAFSSDGFTQTSPDWCMTWCWCAARHTAPPLKFYLKLWLLTKKSEVCRAAGWTLLPTYPFQIQSGVAAVTPLVALKDCNQWPLIWVSQLSRCAILMYCEQWQNLEPRGRRWKSWSGRRGGGFPRGQAGTLWVELTAAILLSYLFASDK